MANSSQQPPASNISSKNRSNLVSLAINILETEKQFHFMSILGQGTYGDVFRMYDPGRDQDIAVKIVTPENISEKELVFWPKLRHRNIVPLLEVLTLGPWSTSVFVMPLQRKNLHDVLCDKRFLLRRGCFNKVKEWLFEILSALEYIRSKQFCHLDIKVDNVLISQRSTAMLCDFSFLNVTISSLKRYDLGLPYIYRPPEACQSLGKKIRIDGRSYDMWGYGVMVVEILTHFVLASNIPDSKCWPKDVYPILFDALQESQFAKSIVRTFPADPIDQHDIKLGLNFIHSFLVKDCMKRITPNEAMRHMFLNHGTFTGWMIDPIWIYKVLDTPVYVEKATQTIDVSSPSQEKDTVDLPVPNVLESRGSSDTSEDQYLTMSETEAEAEEGQESDDDQSQIEGDEVQEKEEDQLHVLDEVEVSRLSPSTPNEKANIPVEVPSCNAEAFLSFCELPKAKTVEIPEKYDSPKSDEFSSYPELRDNKEINKPEEKDALTHNIVPNYCELSNTERDNTQEKTEFLEGDAYSCCYKLPTPKENIKQNAHSWGLKSWEVLSGDAGVENGLKELSLTTSHTKTKTNTKHDYNSGILEELLNERLAKASMDCDAKDDGIRQKDISNEPELITQYRIFKQQYEGKSNTGANLDGNTADTSNEKKAELDGCDEALRTMYQKIQKEFSLHPNSETGETIQQGPLENPSVIDVIEVLESQGATGDNTISNLDEEGSCGSRPFEQCSTLFEVKEPYLSVSNEVRDLRGRLGELDRMFEELEKSLVCSECSEKYGSEEPCRDWETVVDVEESNIADDGLEFPKAFLPSGVLFDEQRGGEAVLKRAMPEEVYEKFTQRSGKPLPKKIPSFVSDASTEGSDRSGRGKKLKKWLRERCLNLERFAQKKPYRILK